MRQTKYAVRLTAQFRRDYKRAMKRGLDVRLLDGVIASLALGEALPEKCRDHALSGNWIGHRECHIAPDWLLLYRLNGEVLVLTLVRTGSHSDLLDL